MRKFYTQTMNNENRESHMRSILKAFSWRVIATTTTITIAYVVTGEVGDALTIGAFGFFLKMFVYYLHERAWQMAPRGTIRKIFRKNRNNKNTAS